MDNFCKFYKQKKQVSYNGGVTWTDVTPPEYRIGELFQIDAADCGYAGKFERWIDSGTTCDGYDKYNIQVKQVSEDGINWTDTPYTRVGSLIESDSIDCGFDPAQLSGTYFTIETIDSCTIYGDSNYNYSTDGGETWNTIGNSQNITVSAGHKIMWKGGGGFYKVKRFTVRGGRFNVEGNIMSLRFGDDFIGKTDLTSIEGFKGLLSGATTLQNAKHLVLPATTLCPSAYTAMFSGCTSLTTPPALSAATTLTENCYRSMFAGCSSLTVMPSLPATTLNDRCYEGMFSDCTSLSVVTQLPATNLYDSDYCYKGMFSGCASLSGVPSNMLPATTLADHCYESMFANCMSLVSPPALPATIMRDYCYWRMFFNCKYLTTAPDLPAPILEELCYYGMFEGCNSMAYIKCLATDISATNCTTNWVYDVASSGTFTKAASMTSWPTGDNGIPDGWAVLNA